MATQFITIEINLAALVIPLQSAIEAQLNERGEPLRWAITSICSGIVRVEAVVLQNLTA